MIKFGDKVTVYIHGSEASEGYVIGEMGYSRPSSRVLLVADSGYNGMPVNEAHVTVNEGATVASKIKAMRLRLAYEDRYPGWMMPL